MFRVHSIRLVVICVAVLAGSSAVMAQGDALRKEFEALHARADEAFKSKDASFFKSLWADDYTSKGKDGKIKDRAQLVRETEDLFASIKEIASFASKVESVKHGKDENEAIVETSNAGKVTLVGPDGQTHRLEFKGKARETWVRTDARWRVRYSEELESNVTEEETPWIDYTSAEGRYNVLLPGKPTLDTKRPELHQAIITRLPGTYSVAYWDLTADQTLSLDDWRKVQIEGLKESNGSVLSDNPVSLNGFPGRELVTLEKESDGGERVGAQRLYKVDERIYLVLFTYLKSDESDALKAKGTKFFDSFQIIKKP
jgi:Domain of unknown function (DUF4440)